MTTTEERFVSAVSRLAVPEVDLVEPVLSAVAFERDRSGWWRNRSWGRFGSGDDASPGHRNPFRRSAGERSLGPGMVLAVMAVIIVAGAATIGPARRAVADWLGIGATAVEIDRPDPPVSTIDRTGDPAADGAADPDLGPSVEALGRPVVSDLDPLPALGPPARIFDHPDRGRSYVWLADSRLTPLAGTDIGLVLSVRRVAGAGLAVKSLASEGDVEIVTIDQPAGPIAALWIDGPHRLLTADSDRAVLAERVLLWEAGGVELRLESGLGVADAVRLAAGVSEGTSLLPPG